jgi:hypothetical protein
LDLVSSLSPTSFRKWHCSSASGDEVEPLDPSSLITLEQHEESRQMGEIIRVQLFTSIFPTFQQSKLFGLVLDKLSTARPPPVASTHLTHVRSLSDPEFEILLTGRNILQPASQEIDSNRDDFEDCMPYEQSEACKDGVKLEILWKAGTLQQILRETTIPPQLKVHRRAVGNKTAIASPALILCVFEATMSTSGDHLLSTEAKTSILPNPAWVVGGETSAGAAVALCNHAAPLLCDRDWSDNTMHNFILTATGCQKYYGCSYTVPSQAHLKQVTPQLTPPIRIEVNSNSFASDFSSESRTEWTDTTTTETPDADTSDIFQRKHQSHTWSPIMRRVKTSFSGIKTQFTSAFLIESERKGLSSQQHWVEPQSLRSRSSPVFQAADPSQPASQLNCKTTDHNSESALGTAYGIALLSNVPVVNTLRIALQSVAHFRHFNILQRVSCCHNEDGVTCDAPLFRPGLASRLKRELENNGSLSSFQSLIGGRNDDIAVDFDYDVIACVLTPRLVSIVFVALLLELKVILLADGTTSGLTILAEFLRLSISPLQWCHVYAPVIQNSGCGILDCPTPYFVGVAKADLAQRETALPLDAVVIDIDSGEITQTPDTLSAIMPWVQYVQRQAARAMRGPFNESDNPSYAGCSHNPDRTLKRKNINDHHVRTVYDDPTGRSLLQLLQGIVREFLRDIELCCFATEDQDELVVFFDEAAYMKLKKIQLSSGSGLFHEKFLLAFLQTQTLSAHIAELKFNVRPASS